MKNKLSLSLNNLIINLVFTMLELFMVNAISSSGYIYNTKYIVLPFISIFLLILFNIYINIKNTEFKSLTKIYKISKIVDILNISSFIIFIAIFYMFGKLIPYMCSIIFVGNMIVKTIEVISLNIKDKRKIQKIFYFVLTIIEIVIFIIIFINLFILSNSESESFFKFYDNYILASIVFSSLIIWFILLIVNYIVNIIKREEKLESKVVVIQILMIILCLYFNLVYISDKYIKYTYDLVDNIFSEGDKTKYELISMIDNNFEKYAIINLNDNTKTEYIYDDFAVHYIYEYNLFTLKKSDFRLYCLLKNGQNLLMLDLGNIIFKSKFKENILSLIYNLQNSGIELKNQYNFSDNKVSIDEIYNCVENSEEDNNINEQIKQFYESKKIDYNDKIFITHLYDYNFVEGYVELPWMIYFNKNVNKIPFINFELNESGYFDENYNRIVTGNSDIQYLDLLNIE